MSYLSGRRTLCYLILILLIVPISHAIAENVSRTKDRIITLPSNIRIKVLSAGKTMFKGGHPTLKDSHISAKIQILKKEILKVSLASVADEFFSLFAPSLHRMAEKKAVVYVVTERQRTSEAYASHKKFVENLALFTYNRIEADRWIPSDRDIPEALKVKKIEKVRLSNGANLFVEKQVSIYNKIFNAQLPSIDLRSEDKIEGNKMVWQLMRQYAKEFLPALRAENKNIWINMFSVPAKEGIHIRRKLFSVVLKKNDNEFWLATSIFPVLFKDNVPGLVLAYQLVTTYEKSIVNISKLENEAKEIMKLHAKKFADNMEVKVVVIQAQWSAEKFKVRVPKYGTVFNKRVDGTWHINSKLNKSR